MRLLMLINKVENRIHAGEAYVAEELAAFYSGLHSIYENIRLPLESELQALEHIADRIFSVGSEVPPSSTTAETAGEATTSVGIPIASIAPAEISAPDAELHKLADDGNPHHNDDEGHPELA